MALDRSPSGAGPASDETVPIPRVAHRRHRRRPESTTPWHGRIALAAVATGATVAAVPQLTATSPSASWQDITPTATGALIQATSDPELPEHTATVAQHDRPNTYQSVIDDDTDVADVRSLTKAVRVGEQLAANALRIKSALADGAPQATLFGGQEFVKPTTGTFTSGFGARWGVTHYGIDLANRIGTPIYAVTDGTIISAGPASGFGLWVRVLHPGGWISVYGHINRALVHVGEQVKAGEQIAEMGNRGQSTGPHLHFEIWDPSGRKINPLPWLAQRGIRVTGSPGVGAD